MLVLNYLLTQALEYVYILSFILICVETNVVWCIELNLCGDKFDEREDGSDVGGRRSQLQALIQEVSSAGMGP